MAGWTSKQLSETLKAILNESITSGSLLDPEDDRIVCWFLTTPDGRKYQEYKLYISIFHEGSTRYYGSLTLEHVCLAITETVAQQLFQAFHPRNGPSQTQPRWDESLPGKYQAQVEHMKDGTGSRNSSWLDGAIPQMEKAASKPNTLAHKVSFVEILNPGNQLGYGWRCSCMYGLLCTQAYNRSVRPRDSYSDVLHKSKGNSMFSLAVSMYESVIHRVTVVCSTREDWDGSAVEEFIVTIPTGLGDQTRFYLADDWRSGVSNPITDIMDILVDQSLLNTREGEVIRKLSQDYATGRHRSTICSYKDHRYGTNNALQKYLAVGSNNPARVIANAFCLLHKGMCIICANNNELAMFVPSEP